MTKLQYNATAPSPPDNTSVEPQCDSRGNQKFTVTAFGGTLGASVTTAQDSLSAATFGLAVITFGEIYNGTNFDVITKANSTARLLSAAATTNATSVKASKGNVFKIVGVNTNAAARYLKIYNKASAPTVGTDTPAWTYYLPPSTVNGGQFDLDFGSQPLFLSLGVAYAITTAAADADATAVTAGDIIAMNIAYS